MAERVEGGPATLEIPTLSSHSWGLSWCGSGDTFSWDLCDPALTLNVQHLGGWCGRC